MHNVLRIKTWPVVRLKRDTVNYSRRVVVQPKGGGTAGGCWYSRWVVVQPKGGGTADG